MDDLTQRYQTVCQRLDTATRATGERRGGPAKPVRLLAVSKSHDSAAIRTVYAAGQRWFGENYAQELALKAAQLRDLADLRFAFIGRLQSNKIALIVDWADAVQSLANERHARLLAKAAAARGKCPFPVHLLVYAGDEASKDGLPMHAVLPFAQLLQSTLPELSVQGVMAIPPPQDPSAQPSAATTALYRQLRLLADQVGRGDLSLGMSDDLALAVAAGSNCVRIGTAIFGERHASPPALSLR